MRTTSPIFPFFPAARAEYALEARIATLETRLAGNVSGGQT